MAVALKKSESRSVDVSRRKPNAQETVTLKRLAADLSEAHKISKKQTNALLGELVDLVTKHLKKGDRIRIGGLGILVVRKRAARMERIPASGEAIQIKARKKGLRNLLAQEPAESAHEPSALARAMLRGKEISENDLRESGGSFTLQDVERLLGISRQAINQKVQNDALIAVPGPHGGRRYPVVQFTSDGILPGLAEVLKSLPSANGWFRLNFLIRPDARLGGRPPIDLLKESKIDPVVAAARAVGVQGA